MAESKATILIVDDEKHVRMLLERILEENRYNVVTAASGWEALEKLSVASISLVLLDIMMPEIDGFKTLELIRKQYSMPVIMVTGVGSVTSVSEALGLGADDYVKKPFQPRELLARVEAKLRRTRRGQPPTPNP